MELAVVQVAVGLVVAPAAFVEAEEILMEEEVEPKMEEAPKVEGTTHPGIVQVGVIAATVAIAVRAATAAIIAIHHLPRADVSFVTVQTIQNNLVKTDIKQE